MALASSSSSPSSMHLNLIPFTSKQSKPLRHTSLSICANSSSSFTVPKAQFVVRRVECHSFNGVLAELPSVEGNALKKKEKNEPELIYKTWLRAKFEEFVKRLIEICVANEADETLKVVLDTSIEFVKNGNYGGFYSTLYHRFLHNIGKSSPKLLPDYTTWLRRCLDETMGLK